MLKLIKILHIFLLMAMFIQPGCLIKGCGYEDNFKRGMEEGKAIGFLEGKNMSYDEVKKETKEYYLDLGYRNGVDKGISEKNYRRNIYKCIVFILIFILLGFFTQYAISLFLRKKGYINDIDSVVTPDINDINLSDISSIDMNKMLKNSISRLETIVERKMTAPQPLNTLSEDIHQNGSPSEDETEYNEDTMQEEESICLPKTEKFLISECQCGKRFKVPTSYSGKKARCKNCGEIFTITTKK